MSDFSPGVSDSNEIVFVHLFTLFFHLRDIYCLPCTKHCSESWGYTIEVNNADKSLLLWSFGFDDRRKINK